MGAVAIAASFMCTSAGFALPLTLHEFQADPNQALLDNPNGGGKLTSLIRQLTLADPNDLPLIINLLMTTTPAQAAAIGSGLGQAALALVRINQPYATQIQQLLAAADNADANAAYAAVTGNQPIGAVGAGGAGSSGGLGGQINPLPTPIRFGSENSSGPSQNTGHPGSPTGSPTGRVIAATLIAARLSVSP
jgi:hypothetical protein